VGFRVAVFSISSIRLWFGWETQLHQHTRPKMVSSRSSLDKDSFRSGGDLPPTVQPEAKEGEMKQKTHCVRFVEGSTSHDVWNRNDLSEAEVQNYWYSKKEYHLIKDAINEAIRAVGGSRHRLHDTNAFCSRGLESQTKIGHQLLQLNKNKAAKVVLEVQNNQRTKGIIDAEEIAAAYSGACRRCVDVAYQRALADSEEAQRYAKTCRRLSFRKSKRQISPVRDRSRRQMSPMRGDSFVRRVFAGKH